MTIQSPFLRQLELPSLDGTLAKTKVLATHYGKSNDYILVQPFTVSPVVWEGVSLIAKKYQITLSKNISIVQLPTKPVGVNFCPCIFWTISEGVGRRYKLWDNVGEILFADLYTNQRIPSTFILEIWNTAGETDVTLATTLEIIVSTLSAHTTYCGDGGVEADSNTISGGDYVFDSGGLSVDYAGSDGGPDHWHLTPLDTVIFHDIWNPLPITGPESPDDVTTLVHWFDAEYLPITKPGIVDGQVVGITYPVYSTWVSKPPTSGVGIWQTLAGARPTYQTNEMGSKPGVLFDGGDSLSATGFLPGDPGNDKLVLAVVCKQVTQAGSLWGSGPGGRLCVGTTGNKMVFGYDDLVLGWTVLESDALVTGATDAKLLIFRMSFDTGVISFRENKTNLSGGTVSISALAKMFTNMCIDTQTIAGFGGLVFEWILWVGQTFTDADLDSLYDNYFKPKWNELP